MLPERSSGEKINSVSITSSNGGNGNTSTDTLYVRDPQPNLALMKQIGLSASGPWTSFVPLYPLPQNVYYLFTIENTGDVPLTSIGITDAQVSTATCPWPASLPVAVQANENHIATCVVGPVNVTVAGSVTNTATAHGTYNSTVKNSDPDTATYASVDLTLDKTAVEKYYTTAGQVIHYTYVVTNPGYAPLRGPVVLTDDMTSVICPLLTTVGDGDDWFDRNESMTCTSTYTTTSATSVTNTATVSVGGYSVVDAVTVNQLPANFGHLPDSYTNMNLFANGGASHVTNSTAAGTYLGTTVPVESDGINAATYTTQATDNGVAFNGTWIVGAGNSISIAYHCPTGCYVSGWIDWGKDSAFTGSDYIIQNQPVSGTGSTTFTFTIPLLTDLTDLSKFYGRFRIYSANPGTALPNGQAVDTSGNPTVGEVEDYEITMQDGHPITTPVTLSYFRAQRKGDSVTFTWSTATETGNVGFNLYVGDEKARTLINSQLIGSKVIELAGTAGLHLYSCGQGQ